ERGGALEPDAPEQTRPAAARPGTAPWGASRRPTKAPSARWEWAEVASRTEASPAFRRSDPLTRLAAHGLSTGLAAHGLSTGLAAHGLATGLAAHGPSRASLPRESAEASGLFPRGPSGRRSCAPLSLPVGTEPWARRSH